MSAWPVRRAEAADLDQLADLWHQGWRDAHEGRVPDVLTERRTRDSLRARLDTMSEDLRVAGPIGAPLGMCLIKGAELNQLYVARDARGTGVAAALMADGEARLAASGVRQAFLHVIEANPRARAFYARAGWRDRGVEVVELPTADGPVPVPVMVMVKDLSTPRSNIVP